MNATKQKELLLENGQLKIRNRALEDQLAASDKALAEKINHMAVVCLAFKKYIKTTQPPSPTPMSDEDATAKLNALIRGTVAEINAETKAKEKKHDAK